MIQKYEIGTLVIVNNRLDGWLLGKVIGYKDFLIFGYEIATANFRTSYYSEYNMYGDDISYYILSELNCNSSLTQSREQKERADRDTHLIDCYLSDFK